ncbi:hypothetical protein LCGC14_2680350, partial [marine sediment metagenome]
MRKKKKRVAPKFDIFRALLLKSWSKGPYRSPTEIASRVYD